MSAQADLRQHCLGYFSAKRCLCALGQHCTSNFLVQCCLKRILTILYREDIFCNVVLILLGKYSKGKTLCNICNGDVFFSQKATTLKASENQTNQEQLQNTKTIDSKASQNKNTPGYFCNNEKESQKDKQE